MPKRNDPQFDKLYKVRPLINKLSETFETYFHPSECQSIDECMVKFKGRSSIKQYMPMKPAKCGYKAWVRASESGYVSQLQFYTGKEGSATEKNRSERVVKDMIRTLVGKKYKIFLTTISLQLT